MPTTSPTTRDRLLLAATEITEEGGYGAASVQSITSRAGLATGTLYRHFGSKAELFVELFRVTCEREVAIMRKAAATTQSDSAAERLDAVVGTFAERALGMPRFAWALIAEPVDPLVDAERLAYRALFARLLAAAMREEIESGELPEQNAELTAAAIVGGVGEALVGPLSPVASGSESHAEVVEAVRIFARRAVGLQP